MKVPDEIPAEGASRANFLRHRNYAACGTIAVALGVPALVYLLFPAKAQKEEDWQEIGDARQLQTKVPTEVVFRRNRKDGWKVTSEKSTAWLVKMADQSVVAYGPHCTHLGCAYHWEDRQNALHLPMP